MPPQMECATAYNAADYVIVSHLERAYNRLFINRKCFHRGELMSSAEVLHNDEIIIAPGVISAAELAVAASVAASSQLGVDHSTAAAVAAELRQVFDAGIEPNTAKAKCTPVEAGDGTWRHAYFG